MTPTKRTLPLAAILLLILALTGTVAAAMPPAQEEVSEDLSLLEAPVAGARLTDVLGDDADEDGFAGTISPGGPVQAASEAGESRSPAAGQPAAALQPDDTGYTGPVELAGSAPAEASETQPAEAPNWDQFFLQPQPDQNGDARSPEDWSAFYYVHVAGTTLRPRDSASGWDYPGVGCVSRASGSELLNIHLPIPNGSRIDYLRLYYYDTSANNSRSWITTYDSAGGFVDIASIDSTGAAGYGTRLSAYVGHVVNTATDSYVLNWDAQQNGSTMRLCGLRVAYRLPV